ncbi:MAG TPA: RDD family protein, partial [Micromonosporaceae bacterium]
LIAAVIITSEFGAGDGDAQGALELAELVVILAAYPIIFEWLTHGRTLGKMALGLRVVRDDAGPIGFRQALVRGLAGFLLEKPGIALGGLGLVIGSVTIGVSSSSKRLGDMMAGTFVVNERAGTATTLRSPDWWVPPALYGWAQALDLSRLDDRLALGVRQFVLRAGQMSPGAQIALGEQYREQVLAVIAPAPPPGVPTPLLLTTVLAERRRRAELMPIMAPSNLPTPAGVQSNAGWPGQPRQPDPGPSTTVGGTFAPPS